ncbi:MAG: membrane protein insertion efficiency factor YidD [Candidatus Aminicenantales bacterium]
MKQAALLAIRLYQLVISPVLGGQCRFHPTCSAYTREAIEKYGLAKGISLGGRRLLKCHPFHPGGVDTVP